MRSDQSLAHLRIVSGPLQGLQGPNKGNGAADYLDRVYQHGIGLFGWGRDGRHFPFDGVGYHLYVHEVATDNLDQQAVDLDGTYRAYLGQMLEVIRKHEGGTSRCTFRRRAGSPTATTASSGNASRLPACSWESTGCWWSRR